MRRVVLAVVVGTVLAVGGAAVAAPLARTFGDGIHRVGKDVRPGTYRTLGGSSCYWARLSGFSGELDDIIANDLASGPAVVTIERRDKGFESSRCGTWTTNLKRITKSKTRFGQGTYIVGVDIAPGTYRSSKGRSCYWARLSGFRGELDDIIANGLPSGRAIVTIEAGDRGFESSRCGTWRRV